jgi:hypothetical protein
MVGLFYLPEYTNQVTMTNYSDFIKAQAKLMGLTYKQAQQNEIVKEAYKKQKKKSMTSIEFLASSGFFLEFKSDEELKEMTTTVESEVIELNAEYKKNKDEDIKQKLIKALKHQILICNEQRTRLEKKVKEEEAFLSIEIKM